VRKSGTENLIRIMVEGKKLAEIQEIAEEIAQKLTIF
jgi:phosphomannomutase